MQINVTDTSVILEEGADSLTLFEKLDFPDYSNFTTRPLITYYYEPEETIWERFSLSMPRLMEYCPADPYLGCYALLLRRLYPVLLSDARAKNVASYGAPADCGAHLIFQDFMTFLQKGNGLTALPLSPFSIGALADGSFHAFLYRLDVCPALQAVCDALRKVRKGGRFLLYTIQEKPPAELAPLLDLAKKDCFSSCTVYRLTIDEALLSFALAQGTEAFLLAGREELLRRAGDLQNLTRALAADPAFPKQGLLMATALLQQTEEILLTLTDHLKNEHLPLLANALKEAVLDYALGGGAGAAPDVYRRKLTEASENFFAAVSAEFQ